MKHIDSSTTSQLAKVPRPSDPAGQQAGEAGCDEPTPTSKSLPSVRNETALSLTPGVTVSRRLFRIFRSNDNNFYAPEFRKTLTDLDLDALAAEVAHIQAQDNFEPLGLEGAAVLYETIAATLQVSGHEELGMQVFLTALAELPSGPAKRGMMTVLSQHKYRNMPTIAEIKSATYADQTYQIVSQAERMIRLARSERVRRYA